MDKKNTMLLTVIAIATLLVAVIGATFAYFGVTGNATSTNSVLTSNTDQVGTVSIATTNAAMHIDTTANDFREAIKGTTEGIFWAAEGASSPVRSDYNSSETQITAFTLTATGASTVHYVCTVGVTATTTVSQGNYLKNGEYAVRMKATDADTTLMNVYTNPSANNTSIAKTFTIHLAGSSTSTITASAKLVNTTEDQSSWLSNASIQTTFAIASYSCTTEASSGTNTVADTPAQSGS